MKILNIILTSILLILITSQPVEGSQSGFSFDQVVRVVEVQARELDKRAKILADYLASKGSPLQYHAQDFIDAADHFGMDWKLVPAIAGVESGFGKRIPGGHGEFISYNAWGWGVYGDQSLGFKSWRDGIFTVSGGLKNNYINKGLTDPYAMNRIYAASPTWGQKVSFFLNDLDNYAKKRQTEKSVIEDETKVAGSSATLASK